ncbi:hypothetical protein BDQ12DRAFT_672037, partial [Crucibulum laeve]
EDGSLFFLISSSYAIVDTLCQTIQDANNASCEDSQWDATWAIVSFTGWAPSTRRNADRPTFTLAIEIISGEGIGRSRSLSGWATPQKLPVHPLRSSLLSWNRNKREEVYEVEEYTHQSQHRDWRWNDFWDDICGLTYDDEFAIPYDACSRWCHAACCDIVEGEVSEEWRCWECQPRDVYRERAVRLQKARIRVLEERKRRKAEESVWERKKAKRKGSPGVERKRSTSAAAIEGDGGKRLSALQPHQQLHHSQQQHIVGHQQCPSNQDKHTAGYIPILRDLVSQTDIRAKLRQRAKDWRGITALSTPSVASQSFSPFSQPTTPVFVDPHVPLSRTHIRMLPLGAAMHPALATHTHLSVHPPTYASHTASPVSSSSLITKYTLLDYSYPATPNLAANESRHMDLGLLWTEGAGEGRREDGDMGRDTHDESKDIDGDETEVEVDM